MRPPWARALVAFPCAVAIVAQSGCTATLKVPEADYARQNDDPAKRYRIVTTDNHIYIATRIATTESTVTIVALENQGEILLFDGKRYNDVALPLTLQRRDITSLARMERTKQSILFGAILTPIAIIAILAILIGAGGGIGPAG